MAGQAFQAAAESTPKKRRSPSANVTAIERCRITQAAARLNTDAPHLDRVSDSLGPKHLQTPSLGPPEIEPSSGQRRRTPHGQVPRTLLADQGGWAPLDRRGIEGGSFTGPELGLRRRAFHKFRRP